MAGTKFERLEIGGPNVAVFRISGKLGFHENHKIKKLARECDKRNFKKVVFDFSELTSLGGGVAKILREFVKAYKGKGNEVIFVVTNDIVLQFLHDDGSAIAVVPSLSDVIGDASGSIGAETEDAGEKIDSGEAVGEEEDQDDGDDLKIERPEDFLAAGQPEQEDVAGAQEDDDGTEDSAGSEDAAGEPEKEAPLVDSSGVILMSYDGEIVQEGEGAGGKTGAGGSAGAGGYPREGYSAGTGESRNPGAGRDRRTGA